VTTVADVNVLLPILVADHAFHAVAWRWWERQPEASVGLCLLSRLGTSRTLTNAGFSAASVSSWRGGT
jgi:predicted nucleic acid-binding protein